MAEERRPTIYQSNPMVEGRKPFGVLGMRLFLLALQHVNPHISKNDKYYDKEFMELSLTPGQVKEIFGNGAYLHLLEKTCDEMMRQYITIRDENEDGGFAMISIFSVIRYKPKEGLRIKFNEDMRPFILEILSSETGYTKLDARQLFGLHSSHAVRLVELMLQYRGMMKNHIIMRYIGLEELRFLMNIQEGTYEQVGSLVRIVLDLPIKDINENTEYRMTYTKEKTGRKITGFTFYMDCRNIEVEAAKQRDDVKLEALPPASKRYGLSEKVVRKLIGICGSKEEFQRRAEYGAKLAQERKLNKPIGFIYKAIEENYLKRDADIKAAIEREQRAIRENEEWEIVAAKLFSRLITVEKNKPEVPFDLDVEMDRIMMKCVKAALKERNVGITTERILREHNMSVGRFLELYCGTVVPTEDDNAK